MIKDEQQLLLTKTSISGLVQRKQYLVALQQPASFISDEIFVIERTVTDLENEIQWYENARLKTIVFDSIMRTEDIVKVITGKRIQLSITQEQLAKTLGLSISEYFRLEDNDFFNIPTTLLSRICEILDIRCEFLYSQSEISKHVEIAEKNLQILKPDKQTLLSILPTQFDEVKKAVKNLGEAALVMLRQFEENFFDLFRADIFVPFNNNTLFESMSVAYKRPINIQGANLTFITAFAANAAWLVAKQNGYTSRTIKADPIEIRKQILVSYGNVSYKSCLQYIWDIGISVLPLNIPRGFHGACFLIGEKRVIVLNQRNQVQARWKFDLLHELYHALTMRNDAYIEYGDIFKMDSEIETTASKFAENIIFGSEADVYVEDALNRSAGSIEVLKKMIIEVSLEYGISVDDFANYFAYRTSNSEINTWGIASNLQLRDDSPNRIAQDILLSRLSIHDLNSSELLILQQALEERTW